MSYLGHYHYLHHYHNYPYEIITPPATLLVDLNLFKTHLKLICENLENDTYLNFLLRVATNFAERYTRRTFINTEFKTYRNHFSKSIELRRSKLQNITSMKYYSNDVLIDVDSNLYYFTQSNNYSSIRLKHNEKWPTNIDIRSQAIQIDFIAGYGETLKDFPEWLQDIELAIMQHATALYENRGDCDMASVMQTLPNSARAIYDLIKIQSINGLDASDEEFEYCGYL